MQTSRVPSGPKRRASQGSGTPVDWSRACARSTRLQSIQIGADIRPRRIWRGAFSRAWPHDAQSTALRKLRMLNNAKLPQELAVPPNNQLEALKTTAQASTASASIGNGASASSGRQEVPTVSKSSTTTSRIPSPTPGEVLLLEFIEPMGLTQNGLARAIGCRRDGSMRSCSANDRSPRIPTCGWHGISESRRASGFASRPTTTCCGGGARLMLTWRGSRRIGGPRDWNVPDEVRGDRGIGIFAASGPQR